MNIKNVLVIIMLSALFAVGSCNNGLRCTKCFSIVENVGKAAIDPCYAGKSEDVEECAEGVTHCRTIELWAQNVDKNQRALSIRRGCRSEGLVCQLDGEIFPRYVCEDCKHELCNSGKE